MMYTQFTNRLVLTTIRAARPGITLRCGSEACRHLVLLPLELLLLSLLPDVWPISESKKEQ